MIDLLHTLYNADLGYLKMIADAWGFTIQASDTPSLAQMLAKSMLNPQIVEEMIAALPQNATQALQDLLENDGIIAWSQFTNRHGELRSMGAAKRDRQRPDLYPQSAVEVLWYKGLIGKEFFDLDGTSQEYAYIPDDLVPFMIMLSTGSERVFGRPASPKECALVNPANDHILDDICTLLSGLRMGMSPAEIPAEFLEIPTVFLVDLLKSSGTIETDLQLQPEAVRQILEEERGLTLARLVETWFNSQKINELRMLPHLRFEGTWQNYPLETRRFILEVISSLAEETWWSLEAFVAAIKEHHPDFQRPGGDYDSWFIQEKSGGTYLKGRSSWDKVEGSLIRFILCGPMHWLGLLDLARPTEKIKSHEMALSSYVTQPSAFRLSAWAKNLWHGSPPDGLAVEDAPLLINMDGRMRATPLTPRSVRYQAARFGEWENRKGGQYIYRVTNLSLKRAADQGLRVHHLLSILKKHASGGIPPAFQQTLSRWEKVGLQTRLITATVLQVDQPEILVELMKTPAKRFLGQVLNPTTVEVLQGGEEPVRNALLQLGYFSGSERSFSIKTSHPSS